MSMGACAPAGGVRSSSYLPISLNEKQKTFIELINGPTNACASAINFPIIDE